MIQNIVIKNGFAEVAPGSIERVVIRELPYRYRAPYGEQPTRYMVQLKGNKRLLRVYSTALGNTAVVYLKSCSHIVYCETELERALSLA